MSFAAVNRLRDELGELVARHEQARGLEDFRAYADNPVGFLVDVLRMEPWEKQRDIADLVARHRLVRARSAQGVGKTYVAAGLILWWLYANGPSAVVSLAPTERQVREILWREIHSLFVRVADLPGELYQQGLRISPNHFALGFSTRDAGRLTGFHHPRLFVAIDEAHGLESFMWEAVFALATGERNKVLAIGNPGAPTGKWFELNRSPAWEGLTISALDHPNILERREVIPGGPSEQYVADIAREYGAGSSIYRARVLGEFPEEAEDGLIRRSWCEAAAHRRDANVFTVEDDPVIVAVDPARYGPDSTALAVRQGPVLRQLLTWHGLDLMETVARVDQEARPVGVRPERYVSGWPKPYPARGYVVVDEIGIGAGVKDRLRELGYQVSGFNGGFRPRREDYLNTRAEAFWGLRKLLEAGEVGLPWDDRLFDELTAIRWKVNTAGKIVLESKDLLRDRLGRSPDRADAVAMAFYARPYVPLVAPFMLHA